MSPLTREDYGFITFRNTWHIQETIQYPRMQDADFQQDESAMWM